MQVIIPLREIRNQLETRLDFHARKYRYEEIGKIHPRRLTDLLEGFVVDHVTARLKHGLPTGVARDLMNKYWPCFDDASREQLFKDTMADIRDTCESKLRGLLPELAWNIWTCQQIGADLLLNVERDFRIVEWERLTNYNGDATEDELRLFIAEPNQNRVETDNDFANPDYVAERNSLLPTGED
jgi:hypothetical protein